MNAAAGNGSGPPKKRKLAPQDRQEIFMLYEDILRADSKCYGEPQDERCISILVHLLWHDDGYKYLGDAIDEVVRLGWLINDYKRWAKNVVTRLVTHGETGNPQMDDELRRTKWVRRLLTLKNMDPIPGEPSHRRVELEKMTFLEHRQKGREYFEEAEPLLRKGRYHTALYTVGEREGLDLAKPPPREILEIEDEPEPPDEGANGQEPDDRKDE